MDNLEIFDNDEKINLLKSVEKSYIGNEKLFYSAYKFIVILDFINFKKESDKINSKLIADFNLFQSINLLEITLAYKNYLAIEAKYFERFYAIKSIIVSLNEGYKKLFHFYEDKRSISMWKSKIEKVVNDYLIEYKPEFYVLTDEIIKYQNAHQNFILKMRRSKFLHFEGEIFDYAEEIKKINAKEIIENSRDYILLNNKLNGFAQKLFNEVTKCYYS